MFDEQTARNSLLASASSYDNNSTGFADYQRIDLIQREDGFKAHIFQKASDPTDVVVALTGTEDLVDAFADANLGTNQWKNNGQDLIRRISQIGELQKVTFSGHSLGGALAQFAAYDFLKSDNGNGNVDVSLVTFNSLGGEEGIRQIEQDRNRTFDPTRLDNIDAAHFVDTRDVVARLGNGHLGGEVIAHDFGSEDGLSAHKLDTSFLAENNQNVLLVGDGTIVDQAYLDVSDGLSIAAGMANRFNLEPLESVTTAEATVGVLAAAEALFAFAPTEELNQLGEAFFPEHDYISDWGDIRNGLVDPLTPLPNPHRLSDNAERAIRFTDAMLDSTREIIDTGKVIATEGIEQTARGLKEMARGAKHTFDYVDEFADDTFDSVRDATTRAYVSAVDKASEGIERLVEAYESAEDFTVDQIDNAERFYDDTTRWVGEQIHDAADVIGRAHDTAVQNTSELIEQIDGTYQTLKEESLDSAKEFVKDRLRDVTGLLRHAEDGFSDLAASAGDSIRRAGASFMSALPLAFIQVSPLVLDLDADGYELSALDQSKVRFDLDADGFAERTGWVNANDALLALDRNDNGRIDSGAELFGDHTPVSGESVTHADGFAALAELDSNRDAVIDSEDNAFADLRIWKDLDQDGASSPLELTTLAGANISGIRLDAAASTEIVSGHRILLESTVTYEDGVDRPIADIFFQVDRVNAKFSGDYQLSMEALMLPLVRGYGQVPHLHIAMSRDPALLSRVQALVSHGMRGSANLIDEIEQLIIHWTGSENINPASRGQFVDARKLGALEAFMATPFVTQQGITDPGINHAGPLDAAWKTLRTGVVERFVAQHLEGSPFEGAGYDFATDSVNVPGSLPEWIESAKTQQPHDSSDAIAYWHNIADLLRHSGDALGASQEEVEASLASVLTDTALERFSPIFSHVHLGGSAEQDELQTGNDYHVITAGKGDDSLEASGLGYKALFGGQGDDQLSSHPLRSAPTQFIGGAGQDTLIGSRYADVYHFDLGDGQDVIDETAGGFTCRNRTVFIIAHRLSAIREAQRVFVLERGQIVESGNPKELLKQAGHFARLHALQAEG